MREFRGAGGGGREHVKDIFNPPEPDMHEEKQTNGAGRRESLSESSVSSIETNIIHGLQKEMAKTREKMLHMKKETTLLKILLAEQTAARMEIESKCKFELELLLKEAEEERKKRKKIQAQIEGLKITEVPNKDPKEKKPPAKAAISPKKTKKI